MFTSLPVRAFSTSVVMCIAAGVLGCGGAAAEAPCAATAECDGELVCIAGRCVPSPGRDASAEDAGLDAPDAAGACASEAFFVEHRAECCALGVVADDCPRADAGADTSAPTAVDECYPSLGCGTDAECVLGAGGVYRCALLTGSPPDADCASNDDCASGVCEDGRCGRDCFESTACPSPQVCVDFADEPYPRCVAPTSSPCVGECLSGRTRCVQGLTGGQCVVPCRNGNDCMGGACATALFDASSPTAQVVCTSMVPLCDASEIHLTGRGSTSLCTRGQGCAADGDCSGAGETCRPLAELSESLGTLAASRPGGLCVSM